MGLYKVKIHKRENNIQGTELILQTDKFNEAQDAYLGTVIRIRYNLKHSGYIETSEENKTKFVKEHDYTVAVLEGE